LRDFVFADAPGEWFQRWAVNEEASDAEGARWIARHADLLLVTADREALSGASRGTARHALQLLATRLGAERRGRPSALLWTKADHALEAAMEDAIRLIVRDRIPEAVEFLVSIKGQDESETGTGLRDVFRWLLETRRAGVRLPPRSSTGTDPLFLVGRR
jgi:hypothetical protein